MYEILRLRVTYAKKYLSLISMIVLIIDNMSFINKEGNIMKNNNIEEIRSKKGISLDTSASKLRISPEKLESIENGEE